MQSWCLHTLHDYKKKWNLARVETINYGKKIKVHVFLDHYFWKAEICAYMEYKFFIEY
jgi:hypothetical protein